MSLNTGTPLPMEALEDRQARFQNGPPFEVISTLTNSINNGINEEIAAAASAQCWSLVLIGIHAVALTIAEGFTRLRSEGAYGWFLGNYMDGDEAGSDYSAIAHVLHEWRNLLAHQWLGASGHSFGPDVSQESGWKRRGDILVLNPMLYHEAFRGAFSRRQMWRPDNNAGGQS